MNRVFFLDRDGTLNVDHGYVNEAEKFEWCEGVFEGLRLLQEAGFTLAVVTNQSGIGHGLYTEEAMHALHKRMEADLAAEGITLAAIEFCAAKRGSNAECRKPNTGMAKAVEKKIGPIDYTNSWMIGDKDRDVQFGKNLGAHTALIRSGYWELNDLDVEPELIVDSVLEAAKRVTSDQ